jgi:hypothetical protein
MDKKIQDYLHLYMGCEGIAKTIAPFKTRLVVSNWSDDLRDGIELCQVEEYNFKPILRPLSDMTKDEESELRNIWSDEYETGNNYTSIIADAAQIKWLLSKHFDLFGLIEAGLAIDATTLKESV